MKIEKSNNPAGVAALILVLILIVGRIVWMVFSHGGTVAAASTAPTAVPSSERPATAGTRTPSATTAAKADTGMAPLSAAATSRNPFIARPTLAVIRLGALRHPGAAGRAVLGVETAPLTSLPPLPVHVLGSDRGVSAKPLPSLHGPSGLPSHETSSSKEAAAAPTLQLTAVIGGTESTAVVQTTNPQPVILHVGDCLDGMHVVAIHDAEVVFARGSGFWTLPLQSAADSSTASTASANSAPPPPEPVLSVAGPEEKTDDSQ